MNTKLVISLLLLLTVATPVAIADHSRINREWGENRGYSSTSQFNYNNGGTQQNIFIQNNYYYGRNYRTRSDRVYEYDGPRRYYRDLDYSTWYYYEQDGERYRSRCDRRRCDY